MRSRSLLSVISVTYNSSSKIDEFFTELYADESGDQCEVVIVDSGSRDVMVTSRKVASRGARFLSLPANVGYGLGSNSGAAISTGDWLAFVNPDTHVSLRTLAELCKAAHSAGLAAAGPTVLDGVEVRRTFGRTVVPPWRRRHAGWSDHGDWFLAETISGFCMVVRRDVFQSLGGFDRRFFLFSEEMDLHRRMLDRGLRLGASKSLHARTEGGASSEGVTARWRLVERARGQTLYVAKHFTFLEGWLTWLYNVARILASPRFAPRGKSLSQFLRNPRRSSEGS